MTSVSITAASDLKREGNAFYAQGKAVDAILKYKEALGLLLGAKDGDVTSPTAMLENAGEAYAYDRKTVTSNVAAAPDSKNNNNTNNTNKADPNAKDIAILFSNASQALLDLKRNEAAAASAAAAVSHDPTLLKAWVRRVRALLAMASRFEAFIVFYIHIAPIVRNAQTTTELAEIEAIIGDLQDKVSQSVGVTNVNPGLGLRLTHHEAPKNADGTPSSSEASAKKADGGLSTVAIRPIIAETVIFMEKQFAHDKLDAAAPKETLNDLSSEELVKHFSAQLVKCVRSKKAGEAELLWTQFASTMRGSWPRNLNEISVSLADHFITELRAFHKKDIAEGYIVDEDAPSSDDKPTNADDDDEGFGQVSSNKKKKAIAFSVTLRELTHLAVACRYNCFHSGFFRACALANHGCNPNAAMKYVESEKKVVLVAVRDIAVGEDITVKYLLDFEYVMGVSRRRELSHRSWLFWCNCGRCEKDLFDKDAAQCEWVRCRSCNDPVKGYAHLPNKGLYGGASDPSVPDFGICRGCGEEVRLSKEDTVTALQTVQTLYATFSQPQVPLQVMGESLVNAWRTAHPLVHEEHWTHRVQLYCYCLPLSEFITNIFNMLASRQLKPEDCTDFLYSFGLCKPYEEGGCGLSTPSAAAAGGGDILVALLELWRRIEPFYPPAQAWQLHLMIIKLLVINLLQPEYTCTMDCDLAAEILSQHTPFIGANERSAHARIMMNRKDLNKDIKWTPKATKLIKKAFS